MPLVFTRLGRLTAHRPWWIITVWVMLVGAGYSLAVAGVHGENLFDRLSTGAPDVAGSQSAEGQRLLDSSRDSGPSTTLALTGVDPTAEGVAEAMEPVRARLAAIDGVVSVVDPLILPALPDGRANPAAAALIAVDGQGFLVVVELSPDLSDAAQERASAAVVRALHEVPGTLRDVAPKADGAIGSNALIVKAITDQVQEDLRVGEVIALPIALLVMIAVFGGFMAAGIPIIGALASIGSGLAALLGVTYLMEVEASAVNVVTVLGLGLSIDYGLLIVSRYREELHRLLEAPDDGHRSRRLRGEPRSRRSDGVVTMALENTMATAGRTVAFSALTIAVSIAGLLVFRPAVLRAIGVAASAVVLIALATALTLVPALLRLSRRRLHRRSLLARVPGLRALLARTADVASDSGFFSRLATRVQRHPWLWLLGAVGILVVLALPVRGLELRTSGVELLPSGTDQRQFVELLADQYPATQEAAITVVAETSLDKAATLATRIGRLDNVASVDPPTPVGSLVTFGVRLATGDSGGADATATVREIRALNPTFQTWTVGQAASQLDFVDAVRAGLPWAVAVVALATLALLFLMTGSLVLGIKALLTNVLSLAAALGVLVWAFQYGHLESVLGFTSPGGLESYVVVMVVAFAFGLAMDYEVFLLSRVTELHRQGMDTATAVRLGLQRSARIITSAAAVIIVVFAGLVAGSLLIIKEVGFALAVAVLIDATLVRMILVPATMSLLGRWNWWSPAPLRRVHERMSLIH
ncbi:MAG: MMPL family transporter [Micrococcales bacterium]|nr:MMPL family transporter [Micrococcales bacterium]